jgi:DHA2 family multidrug resistance protein
MNKTAVNPWLIAPLVALAAFMEVLDISIANVSLQHIAGSLGASPDEATWVLTAYLVTNAIALPVSGWLSEYFGRTRFFMGCIAGFTLSSLACGLAPSLTWLIIFRTIQGLTGGALQPVSQAILADSFPIHQRAMAFSIYGIAVVAAPAIGPTLGGWITDQYSWHWIFLINVPIGMILISLIQRFVPLDAPPENRKKVDYFGFSLIAIGLGCLQWVLDRGQHDDWFDSYQIIFLTLCVIVALIWYVLRAKNHRDPIVDIRLFSYRNYALTNLFMFVLGFVLLGSTAMLPLFMQTLLGYTAMDAGLVISPGGIAIMIMMPIVGKLASSYDPRWLISFGLGFTGIALWHLGQINLEVTHVQLAELRVWQTLGLAFLFIPITTMAYVGLPDNANNQTSAMLALMRNLGGGVGIALLVTLLERLGQSNRSILSAHTSSLDLIWQHKLAALTQLVGNPQTALALLDQQLTQQAKLLAFMDGFRWLAVLFFILMPLVWFLKPLPPEAFQKNISAH